MRGDNRRRSGKTPERQVQVGGRPAKPDAPGPADTVHKERTSRTSLEQIHNVFLVAMLAKKQIILLPLVCRLFDRTVEYNSLVRNLNIHAGAGRRPAAGHYAGRCAN